MFLDIIAFFGLTIVVLVALAETKKPVLGIFASVFLLVLSLWIISEPIQYKSGEVATITSLTVQDCNCTYDERYQIEVKNTTVTSTENVTYIYSDVPLFAYTSLQSMLGLPLILLSIYGIWYYAGEITLRGM